jgi:opacity protein-like surface antigen
MKKVIPAALVALLFTGTSAFAQSGAFGPRAYVAGLGGLTFGTETDATFGGEFGRQVSESLQVYGHLTRMQDTLPRYVNEELRTVSQALTTMTGVPWSFSAKAPAWLGVGGVRWTVPTAGRVRPYALGGAGFGHVRMKLSELSLGDVTGDVLSTGYLSDDDMKTTKPLVEMGGGVQVPVGSLYFDAGYRFSKLLDADDFNISRAYAGIGARF